jgi:hypothetical protein
VMAGAATAAAGSGVAESPAARGERSGWQPARGYGDSSGGSEGLGVWVGEGVEDM